MNKDEYKAAKAALGLTHKELGHKIGISVRQSLRYINGHSPVHKAVALRLNDLLERRAACEATRP